MISNRLYINMTTKVNTINVITNLFCTYIMNAQNRPPMIVAHKFYTIIPYYDTNIDRISYIELNKFNLSLTDNLLPTY